MKKSNLIKNGFVRRAIIWAMTFMMAFTPAVSSMGTMTVYAEDSGSEETEKSSTEGDNFESHKSDETNTVEGKTGEAKSDAKDANNQAETAKTSATNAESAQGAAETAKKNAETAKTNAESAQGAAETLAGNTSGLATETTVTDNEGNPIKDENGNDITDVTVTVTTGEDGEKTTSTVTTSEVEKTVNDANEAINHDDGLIASAGNAAKTINDAKLAADAASSATSNISNALDVATTAEADAKKALETILAADPNSAEGNQDAAKEALETVQAANKTAQHAVTAAEKEFNDAALKMEAAKAAYDQYFADNIGDVDADGKIIGNGVADVNDAITATEQAAQEELDAAKKTVKDAQAQLAAAEQAYRDLMESAITTAQTNLTAAEAVLSSLSDTATEEEKANAQNAVDTAKAELAAANLNADMNVEDAIAAAQAKVAADEANKASEAAATASSNASAATTAADNAQNDTSSIKDILAEVTTGKNVATLEIEKAEADQALTDEKNNQIEVNKEQDQIIRDAEAEKQKQIALKEDKISEKNRLNGQLETLKGEKAAAQEIVDIGNSWDGKIDLLMTPYEHYKEVSQKSAGQYMGFHRLSQGDIDYAVEYVNSYNTAKNETIPQKENEITAKTNEIASISTEINNIQTEINRQSDISTTAGQVKDDAVNAVEAAQKTADEKLEQLNKVNNYVFSEVATSREMSIEDQAKYQTLVKDLNDSLSEYNDVKKDTLTYEYVSTHFGGVFTELNIEFKYENFDFKYDKKNETTFLWGNDKNNTNYLIALSNDRCIVTNIDEIELAAFSSSFDTAIANKAAADASTASTNAGKASTAATAASEAAKTAATAENTALNQYLAAKIALADAQAKLDALNVTKNTVADDLILTAVTEYTKAQEEMETAATTLSAAQSKLEAAQNLEKWIGALANDQKTMAFAQYNKDTEELANANDKEFDLADSAVVSRPTTYFVKVSNGDTEGTVQVPYSVFHAYIKSIYGKNTDETKTADFTALIEKNGAKGQGISTGSDLTAGSMELVYWIVDENHKLTGQYYTSTDEMPSGTYFIGYTFKRENDGYHIDGHMYSYEAPTEEQPGGGGFTPITTPPTTTRTTTTTTIAPTPTPLAATPQVLGATRTIEDEPTALAATPEAAVLGADRNPQTGDSTNLWVWLMGMVASAGALAGWGVYNKKSKKEDEE